ncbi:phage protein, partial [Klebsiella pneumoniae]
SWLCRLSCRSSLHVPCRGENTRSKCPFKFDHNSTITVTLLKTSPVNKKLSLMYNAQSQSSATWGNNVIVVRNKVSGDISTARSCAFQKQPDHANAKVGNTVSWVFDCGKIDQLLGEF